MDELKKTEYQQAFLKLKHAYIHRLENTALIIDNILNLEQYNLPKREDILRAQALVHGLAGSGTTFGFPQVTEVGQKADRFLDILLKRLNDGQEISEQDDADFDAVLKHVQNICRKSCRDARIELSESANTNIYVTPGTKDHAHVLIIDDDPDVASAVGNGLESLGMSIQIAGSGEDALHYLARVRPNLVVLDLGLKGIDGLEVLQQIKQNSEFMEIPVLILSARHSDQDEEQALRAGALAYVHKPVDIPSFAEQVARAIDTSRGQAQSM